MEPIFFEPWIGGSYDNCGISLKRVLIIGESFNRYEDDEQPNKKWTIESIEDQISGKSTHAFWTKIVTTFLNKHPSLEDKFKFWHSVAYDTYIQDCIIGGPRNRPKIKFQDCGS